MANTPTSYTAESFPLAKGMQGENIKVLQTALGVEADGKFWNATETALKNLYNVTTCSEELFKQITGQTNKKKGFMNINLSEKAKRGIKIGAICLGVVAGGCLIYSLIDGNKKKSVSSASGKTATAALNGTKKPKKSSKKSKKSGKKVLALQ